MADEKYDPKKEKTVDRMLPEVKRKYLENYGVKSLGVEKGFESKYEVGK